MHFLASFVGDDLSKNRAFDAEWKAEEGVLEFAIHAEHVKVKKK